MNTHTKRIHLPKVSSRQLLIKIGKEKGCYRITLLCDKSLEKFYNKNGFKAKEIAMKLYI